MRLVRRLANVDPSAQLTTAITLGELLCGARRAGREELVDLIWAISDVMPVLPFDEKAADVFASVKAELERSGMPIGEPDLRIAAIALSMNLTLVTGNVRHFSRVPGLVIENWLN